MILQCVDSLPRVNFSSLVFWFEPPVNSGCFFFSCSSFCAVVLHHELGAHQFGLLFLMETWTPADSWSVSLGTTALVHCNFSLTLFFFFNLIKKEWITVLNETCPVIFLTSQGKISYKTHPENTWLTQRGDRLSSEDVASSSITEGGKGQII